MRLQCDSSVYRNTMKATRRRLTPFEREPAAQGCRLMEYDGAPVLYTDDPNVERVS